MRFDRIIEALSNIYSDKEHTYPYWKKHLGRLREACLNNVLPLENYTLAQLLKIDGLVDDDSLVNDDWNRLCDIITFGASLV